MLQKLECLFSYYTCTIVGQLYQHPVHIFLCFRISVFVKLKFLLHLVQWYDFLSGFSWVFFSSSCSFLSSSLVAVNYKNNLHLSYRQFTFIIQIIYIYHTDNLHLSYRQFTFIIQTIYIYHTDNLHLSYR